MTLSRLLGEGRPLDAPVATGDAGPRDFARLRADVAALAGALRARAAALPSAGAVRTPGGAPRWGLVCDDTYAFAVGLLATWHAGAVAVSPPNAQAGTLAAVEGDLAGWLADDPGFALAAARRGTDRAILHPLAPDPPAPQPARLAPLDRDAWVLELFTSGTTGRGRHVRKRLRHLDDEVAWLERRFGTALGRAEVFSTASHQHLYAMLFRVLWPLAAGRPFRADTFLHAEELVPRVAAAGCAALASTPAHLRRLSEHADLAKLVPACRRVFSSGGPLDEETAERLALVLGEAPTEIFGSTETGGVAWRVQRPGRDATERLAFTPFDAVEVACAPDGRLRVRSPFAEGADGRDGGDGLVLGDRATLLPDGRFLLRGRADRTVKVGEKRLSLPDMEAVLRAHPEVADAALLRLDAAGLAAGPAGGGPSAVAARVGAVVVLSAAGRERLAREGRRALGAALAEHLADRFDRALVPRAWRYVDAVPEDTQGKRTQAVLEALFAGPAPAGEAVAAPTRPRLLEEHRSAGRLERVLRVPPDLAWFDGHYPVWAVLPGAALLAWAVDAAGALVGGEPAIARVEALKFALPVRPGDRLRLEVSHHDDRAAPRVRFRVLRGAREVASGRLVLRPGRTAGSAPGAGGGAA